MIKKVRLICGVVLVQVLLLSTCTTAFAAGGINDNSNTITNLMIPVDIPKGVKIVNHIKEADSSSMESDYMDVINEFRAIDIDRQIVTEEITDVGLNIYVYGNQSKFKRIADKNHNVDIAIVGTKYSLVQLRDAVSDVESMNADINDKISGIAIDNYGNGIRIDLDSSQFIPSVLSDEGNDELLPTLEKAINDHVNVPVQFSFSDNARQTSRGEDTAPFSSGAVMTRRIVGADDMVTRCSAGFWGSTSADRDIMITADHCGIKNGNIWHSGWTPNGAVLGRDVAQKYYRSDDINAFVKDNGASISPTVYWGDEKSNDITPIYGVTSYPSVGQSVCFSGAYSGTVCNNTVVDVHYFVNYGSGGSYDELVHTKQSSGIPAVGNGDSGGPVISVIDGKAYAQGVISGISGGTTACTGIEGKEGGRQCSAEAFYAAIAPYMIDTNTRLYVYAG